MVPDGYAAEDLRVVAHKIFKFQTIGGAPLAFYKQYAFQLRTPSDIPDAADRWDYYCLQDRCLTESTYDASRGLQAIYLSESMLFAWKYSISKREAKQTKDDWLLQQAMRQLFYKAKMHQMMANTKTRTHLIYTFKPMTMRPYFPMESDYVASCPFGEKMLPQVDRLELHGCFEREYDAIPQAQRDTIFRQMVQHLRTSMTRYLPWDDDERKRMIAAPTTREEYFEQVRFQQLWKYQEYPQERPKPLIEMEVHDRDYGAFDALPKKDKHQAMVEAFGDERPQMKMGERQVQTMDKKEEQKEPEYIEIVGFERKDVVFPVAKRDPRIQTIFGTVEGPPPKPKCAPLSKWLYRYKNTLTARELKTLPRRTDPKFPEALELHMRAHEQPEPLGFVGTVDLFQLQKE